MPEARLMRSETDKMIAGVCGGIAAYLGIDAVFVRLAFLLLCFASGIGLLLYLVLMIIMPSESNFQQPASKIVQDNIDRFGDDLTHGIKRVQGHPQGRTLAAGLLIVFGLFLLFENLGWLSSGIFWPLALIGLGLYLIIRRSRG
ncbi:MAG: PspC domain-containing protein [Chloroflexota bacterium]|nr:MAG: PspC domain-containing protein [Chloroflexota bacterium]